MKKYICMLMACCLLLGSFALPGKVWADDVLEEDIRADAFTWSLRAAAGMMQDSEGDVRPAVTLDFSVCSTVPDYVYIYRAQSRDGEYAPIGVYVNGVQDESRTYCDSTVVPQVTYYYYAVAGWFAKEGEDGYLSEPSNCVSCAVELRKPLIEAVGVGSKSVKILLPASNFLDEYQYAATEGTGHYATGFQIYRSRKEDSGYKKIATVSADALSYKDAQVTKGKLYFYKVRTYYYDKENDVTYTGPFSELRMCCPGSKNFPNAAALNLTAEEKAEGTVKISWENAAGFIPDVITCACRREGEKSFGKPETAELSSKAKSYTLKGVEANCEYEVRLLIRVKNPYSDGNDNFYYDSRWYVVRFTA